MKFAFNGIEYRIVFRHERSRRWSDHIGHKIEIVTGHTRFAGPVGAGPVAWAALVCHTCNELVIGNIPKANRQRKTWCCIQRALPGPGHLPPIWAYIVSAVGKPNEDKGDRFNRAEGRLHSLANVLAGRVPDILPGVTTFEYAPLPKEFREAAWRAFHGRVKVADSHFAEVPNVAGN